MNQSAWRYNIGTNQFWILDLLLVQMVWAGRSRRISNWIPVGFGARHFELQEPPCSPLLWLISLVEAVLLLTHLTQMGVALLLQLTSQGDEVDLVSWDERSALNERNWGLSVPETSTFHPGSLGSYPWGGKIGRGARFLGSVMKDGAHVHPSSV